MERYAWGTTTAGGYDFGFAGGYSGLLIVLLEDIDMGIVTTVDPFYGQYDVESWAQEKATINLVSEFIGSLQAW